MWTISVPLKISVIFLCQCIFKLKNVTRGIIHKYLYNDINYVHIMDKTVILDTSLFIVILLSVLDVNSSPVAFLYFKQHD